MPYRRRKRRRNRGVLFFVTLFLLFSIGLFLAAGMWLSDLFEHYQVSDERVEDPFFGIDKPIFFQGALIEEPAIGTGDGLLLPLTVFQRYIDPSVFAENDEVVITTADKVIHFRTDQLTAMMNDKPLELTFPLQVVDDQYYLPLSPLVELYGLDIRESGDTGAVLMWKENDVIQWGRVLEPNGREARIRLEPDVKTPVVHTPQPDEALVILDEYNGWYRVLTEDGYSGYMVKQDVAWTGVETIPAVDREPPFVPWKPLGDKINLTWEAVYNVPPRPEQIGRLPGVNVVSPTWFDLYPDENGGFYLGNKADPAYVQWAHDQGYQVWGLVSNNFDPDWTRQMLSSYESRMNVIREIIHYAELYKLQGINIDFENVYLEDKDRFTQFMRELTPFLHEQGLVVSVDVTIRGGSAMWSLFADREELAKVVDYMIVMTYDEHWGSSPVAGSVASLPWVEKGMVDIMREDNVPASKLILGAPTYTRIWKESVNDDGSVSVSSQAVSMKYVDDLIANRGLNPTFDETTGQNYVEYEEDGNRHRIWIEDETSMRARAELVVQYDFAGIATWNRSFAKPEIWEVIRETLSDHHLSN